MLPSRTRAVTVLRALVHEIRAERVTFMAGSIAYHAFVSLLPLLLLVLAAISAVGSTSLQEGLLAGILVFLTWLYFSGLVILLGAVVNAVLTNRSVDVSIRPVVGGIAPSLSNPDYSDEDVTNRLHSIEQHSAHADEVTFVIDGERITLPAPTSAAATTDEDGVLFGSGLAELQLVWRRSGDQTAEE
jgi:membrane protein